MKELRIDHQDPIHEIERHRKGNINIDELIVRVMAIKLIKDIPLDDLKAMFNYKELDPTNPITKAEMLITEDLISLNKASHTEKMKYDKFVRCAQRGVIEREMSLKV